MTGDITGNMTGKAGADMAVRTGRKSASHESIYGRRVRSSDVILTGVIHCGPQKNGQTVLPCRWPRREDVCHV